MSNDRRELLAELTAATLGIAAFFVFAGWWVLIPWNISWLGVADRAMHTLGWMFYRDGPWQWPPGANPALGLELANSIALVDSLPLVAMPLKLLSPWLPRPFQYWGYWWLICFILQSVFAYRLAREWQASRLVAILAAGFALITPAFIFRLTLHMALASHFLLLAALWLYVKRKPPRWWAWPVLMGATAGIHIYLLVMVGIVWGAALLERLLTRRTPIALLIPEVIVGLVAPLTMLYLGGAFIGLGSGAIDGFGAYRLNLLFAVIDYTVWSRLLPSVPHDGFDYEGLGFLGIGIFAFILIALFTRATRPVDGMFTRRWAPLTLAVLFCFLFALSNRIGFADYGFAAFPIPRIWQTVGDMFRSTGRFVWPLLYVLTIGFVVLIGRRFRNRIAVPLLTIAFIAQAVDSSVGWGSFRSTIPAPATSWTTAFTSPFWDVAGRSDYKTLRYMPLRYRSRDWLFTETFAHQYGLETDAIYLGRIDEAILAKSQERNELMLRSGRFDPRTLYLLNLAIARRVTPFVEPGDLFAIVDNRIVFARGGAPLVAGLGIDPQGALQLKSWVPAPVAQSVGLAF